MYFAKEWTRSPQGVLVHSLHVCRFIRNLQGVLRSPEESRSPQGHVGNFIWHYHCCILLCKLTLSNLISTTPCPQGEGGVGGYVPDAPSLYTCGPAHRPTGHVTWPHKQEWTSTPCTPCGLLIQGVQRSPGICQESARSPPGVLVHSQHILAWDEGSSGEVGVPLESWEFPGILRSLQGILRSPQESTRNAWGKVKTSFEHQYFFLVMQKCAVDLRFMYDTKWNRKELDLAALVKWIGIEAVLESSSHEHMSYSLRKLAQSG